MNDIKKTKEEFVKPKDSSAIGQKKNVKYTMRILDLFILES